MTRFGNVVARQDFSTQWAARSTPESGKPLWRTAAITPAAVSRWWSTRSRLTSKRQTKERNQHDRSGSNRAGQRWADVRGDGGRPDGSTDPAPRSCTAGGPFVGVGAGGGVPHRGPDHHAAR